MRRFVTFLAAAALAVPLTPAVAQVPTVDPDLVPDVAQRAMGCDPIDPALCMLPFPNDAFTVAVEGPDSGRLINFSATAMPRNGTDLTAGEIGGEGKPTDPTEWNRNDGFSPGQAVLTVVPGVNLAKTWGTEGRTVSQAGPNEDGYVDHRDQLTDIGLSVADDAPIVILNTETGERHPFWSELDSHGGSTAERSLGADGAGARQALILRPARNYDEGARYVVAMRGLRDAEGEVIEAGGAFAAIRDAGDSADQRYRQIFDDLGAAGIARDDLYLAWDFTVASERNLAERMLAMRDQAFSDILGDPDLGDLKVEGTAPAFTVASVEDRDDVYRDSRGIERVQRLRRIDGTVTVPNFLDRIQQSDAGDWLPVDAPAPGSRLYDDPLDADTLPDINPLHPTVDVPFTCDVPVGEGPSITTLYGHGLLGSRSQLGDARTPRRHGFAGCAMDFWGMSTVDLPTVAAILADLSSFPSLPDRAQQGFLNFMFLARAAVHPDGLVTDPAFTEADGSPLLVTDTGQGTQAVYDGNSQGGIMGGPIVAVSPDVTRGILGVVGMNYSTLLNRSVDWEGAYGEVYYATYQDPVERQLGFQLIQMLWDRGENNGYAHHMTTDPYDNSPANEVMLQIAWSDHQVANVSAEVMARTIGAPLMDGLATGRHWDLHRFGQTASYPHDGSALIYWDSGNAAPPNGNIPPSEGGDPHGHPRSEHAAGWQEARFLTSGTNVDVCGGGTYLTDNHPTNNGTASCQEPDEPARLQWVAPGS